MVPNSCYLSVKKIFLFNILDFIGAKILEPNFNLNVLSMFQIYDSNFDKDHVKLIQVNFKLKFNIFISQTSIQNINLFLYISETSVQNILVCMVHAAITLDFYSN